MTVPSSSRILSQVQAVLERWPDRRRIGLRFREPAGAPEKLSLEWEADGETRRETLRVVPCRSSLELRQRLLESEGSDDVWVFLADLPPTELGYDLEARLAKGRLLEASRWDAVRRLFNAKQVDPRLVRLEWIADRLIEAAPAGGFRPVAGGILDEVTARRALTEVWLGLGDGEASPAALLRWASESGTQARYRAAPAELRGQLAEWLAPAAGPVAAVLVAVLEAGHGGDAVALGLVSGVVGKPEGGEPARSEVLLSERYLGRARPHPEALAAWARASSEAVQRRYDAGGYGAVEPWLRRAEAVLDELEAGGSAIAGEWLPRAFEERLGRAAEALDRWLARRSPDALAAAETAAAALSRHRLAAHRHESRIATLDRALALARWLSRPPARASGLAAAALGYADDGAWVDLARQAVGRGDTSDDAARVYGLLAAAAGAERERQNRRFAELLAAAGAEVPDDPRLAGVEDVLARWAAPLARRSPLLVLVLDGLGQVVWRQILPGILDQGWCELIVEDPRSRGSAAGRAAALAVLPTETRTSRVSLTCGQVAEGAFDVERRGFASHRELAGSGRPPRLFGPGEVKSAGGALAPEVMEEVLGARQVVGVVLGDVDAHFESMSDLREPFNVITTGALFGLLRAAAEADRVVLVTGDHGQVSGSGTELRRVTGDFGGRHRSGGAPPEDGEVAIAGRRVLGGEVVVPWSERVRYSKGGRMGYHGGATPQEMVIPVAVLARRGVEIEGWQALERELPPPWWERRPAGPVPDEAPPSPTRSRRPRPSAERPEASRPPAQLSLVAPESGWLDRLLGSEVYAQQLRLAGRRPPAEEQMRRLLSALDEEGGTSTPAALARALGTSRLGGLLTQASRLLNVDGFGVLTVDHASDTVRLDRPLLEKQFGLAEPRSR